MMEWLGAYHDGELSQVRRQLVEAHLEDCAACRDERALRRLSALVRQAPAPAPSLSNVRFAAQVGLRLPRPTAQSGWRPALRLGWQALPALLVGGWAFAQALVMVAGLALLALQAGLGGQAVSQTLAAPGPLAGLGGLFGCRGPGCRRRRASRLVGLGRFLRPTAGAANRRHVGGVCAAVRLAGGLVARPPGASAIATYWR
jgi:hypothetical protein